MELILFVIYIWRFYLFLAIRIDFFCKKNAITFYHNICKKWQGNKNEKFKFKIRNS